MSDERLARIESQLDRVIGAIDTLSNRMDVMEGKIDTIEEHIDAIRTRIDAEGTMMDAFERNFTTAMQTVSETNELSRNNNRDLGTGEEKVDRLERRQQRMNSRLNDLEDR